MLARTVLLSLALLARSDNSTGGLSKAALAKLDGHVLVGNAIDNSLHILNKDKDVWHSGDYLWSYVVEKGKDGMVSNFKQFNDVKRVVNHNGQVGLLMANNGAGIALYNMETGVFDFSYQPRINGNLLSIHSAEILPDGNFAVADADKNHGEAIRLISGDNTNPRILQSESYNSPHGVVWDKKRKVLWTWGGSLCKYDYNNSKLILLKNYGKPSWGGGGHDLTAVEGEDALMFTDGTGIGKFDIEKEKFTMEYAIDDVGGDSKIQGGKSVHKDSVTGEIAFVKQDGAGTGYPKFRTYQVRNPAVIENGSMKARVFKPNTDLAIYKARWFRHSSFSYPQPSQSPGPDPTMLSTPASVV